MRKILAAILLLTTTPSWGYFIGTTDVGGLDIFLGAAQLDNSSPATEATFLSDIYGGTVTFVSVLEDLVATPTNEDPNVLAADITPGDDLYILKNSNYWAAFDNVELLNWAVFDTGATIDVKLLDDTIASGLFSDFFNLSTDQIEISHITEFSVLNQVPEPSPLALMGIGLLGFARMFRGKVIA